MSSLKHYGPPNNNPFVSHALDHQVPLCEGGIVDYFQAKHQLKLGDFVYLGHDLKATKSVSSSLNQEFALGIVVGGYRLDDDIVIDSGASIGGVCAEADERVIVQRRGICWGVADASGILTQAPLSAGRSTAGRLRGDTLASYARTAAGLVIKAGASALVKAANVTQITVAGVHGTATAANLDQAALSGTVVNGTYNVFEFRVAANGSTVTSAMGTAGATRNAIVFPTASSSLAVLGWVFIHPTGTGDFVGGTTALDDATVVPNAVYVDAVAPPRAFGWALQDGGAAASALLVYLNL